MTTSCERRPSHPCFMWVREGYPKIGEWYDDGNTFEPASMNWKANGHKVNVYLADVNALVERLTTVEDRVLYEVTYTEVGVLRDRLDEMTSERDWLRSLVDRLSADSGGDAR